MVTNPGAYNGNFGVYFNSIGGQANTFAPLATMPVEGVDGDTAGSLTLNNQNVSALDIDGDGIIDLVHMPQVQTYSVYTPAGSGTNYSWVGRAITTASQQSPKIDFGDDAQNIQVMDVNGDGLVDLVYSSGTSLETFFSLGRYPNGDGQFGYGELDRGHDLANLQRPGDVLPALRRAAGSVQRSEHQDRRHERRWPAGHRLRAAGQHRVLARARQRLLRNGRSERLSGRELRRETPASR